MPEVEKFLFDTSFDAPPPAPPEPEPVLEEIPAEPPPPPPPTFSEDELMAAKAQSRAEGLADGFKRGRDEAEAEAEAANGVGQVLEAMSRQMALLLTEQAAQVTQAKQMTLDIALTVARKLLPDYAARVGFGEIEVLVRQVMDNLHHEPRLVIRVAEAQLDAVTARVQEVASQRGFDGKMVFLADPAMGPSDCRVEWAEGGVERDSTRVWNEIDRLVADVVKGIGAGSNPVIAP